MERQITISKETQVLLNAILDLEKLTNEAYSTIRSYLAPEDGVNDQTGQDLLDASLGLRDRLEHYLSERWFDAVMTPSNVGEQAVI